MNIAFLRRPAYILSAAAVVLTITMGIRHSFGLFLPPMSADNGWGREVFAFAMAVQNLLWGAAQPFTGMLADRFGAGKAMAGGTLLYALGLFLMAEAATPGGLVLSAGVLIGLGLSGTTFTVVLGVVGRAAPPEKRSVALGIAAAVGSFGQFAMLPVSLGLMEGLGWAAALFTLGLLTALMVPLSASVVERPVAQSGEPDVGVIQALREAAGHRGFWLLCLGFFVCGFHVLFIAIHLPAFLVDRGMPMTVGTNALALIGLFNIFGTYLAGLAGSRYRKPWLLAVIYFARAVAIAAFVAAPLSVWSVYAFAAAIGFLWLSTVPLTNGTVAVIFGVRNMSMLTGIVFFFHQVGSFLGGWLGGYVYDRSGNYDLVWLIAIGLGVLAAGLNLPIREQPLLRVPAREAEATA